MESHGDFLKVLVSRCSHAFRNLKVFFDRVAISSASMLYRILVIISPATLTAPVRHPLGEGKFS